MSKNAKPESWDIAREDGEKLIKWHHSLGDYVYSGYPLVQYLSDGVLEDWCIDVEGLLLRLEGHPEDAEQLFSFTIWPDIEPDLSAIHPASIDGMSFMADMTHEIEKKDELKGYIIEETIIDLYTFVDFGEPIAMVKTDSGAKVFKAGTSGLLMGCAVKRKEDGKSLFGFEAQILLGYKPIGVKTTSNPKFNNYVYNLMVENGLDKHYVLPED